MNPKQTRMITTALAYVYVMLLATLILSACTQGKTLKQDKMDCQVIQLRLYGEDPICAVECSAIDGQAGYSHAIPVPCSWYGNTVQRRVRSK